MMRSYFFSIPLLSMALCFILGCGSPTEIKKLTASEAHKKLLQLCKEDYGLEIVTKQLPNTMWIYLPMDEDLLSFKVDPQGPQNSDQAKESPSIYFIDGEFQNRTFNVSYDIGQSRSYAKSYGYSTAYNEQFQRNQQNLLSAIHRAYANSENEQHESAEEKTPDFFVIVTADIKNGIAMKTIMYFKDMTRVFEDHSFYEEYTRRAISEYPMGHSNIIGDKEGNHIEYKDVTWPEFLMKQMIYRIQFKYQRSAFRPSERTKHELLSIVALTLDAYNFTDYNSVKLNDLHANMEYHFSPSEVEGFLMGNNK